MPHRAVQAAWTISCIVEEAQRTAGKESCPEVRQAIQLGSVLVDTGAADPIMRLPLEVHYGELAHHHQRSEDIVQAVIYLQRAEQQALHAMTKANLKTVTDEQEKAAARAGSDDSEEAGESQRDQGYNRSTNL